MMPGVIKDVVMPGAYQKMEVDFTADQSGLTLFHFHMQAVTEDLGFTKGRELVEPP